MRNLLVTVSIVLMISHQIQNSHAFVELIGTASTLIGFGQFLVDSFLKFIPEAQSFDIQRAENQDFHNKVLQDIKLILKNTENLPRVLRNEIKEEKIEAHFSHINAVFQRALYIKSKIDGHHNAEYQQFATKEDNLDTSIDEINRIFAGDPAFALGKDFIGNLKTFEDTCKTGMSDFQLLDTLLVDIRVATAQYFWAKKLMYDFLEISGKEIKDERLHILEQVGNNYAIVAKKFLSLMASASTELWKCDPEGGYDDSLRTRTSSDTNFAEIRAFSRYLLQQTSLVPKIGYLCSSFPCSGVKKHDQCIGTADTFHDSFCKSTHLCPGRLRCSNLKQRSTVCINTNKQIPYRYHMFIPGRDPRNYPKACYGSSRIINYSVNSAGGLVDACTYCDCICEEAHEKNGIRHGFFVDNRRIMSNTSSNMIVIGARLVVEPFHNPNASLSGQVLRIQINEAVSLGNGTIGEGSWKKLPPIEEKHLIEIQWDKNRRFYLSPVMVGEDEVITGLALNKRGARGPAASDFILKVFAHEVNFYTGVLNTSIPAKDYRNTETLTKSYDLRDVDVPTRARMKNELLSSTDQYVDLSLTSDRRDGGQSTVPFIDSQKWSAKTLLAGASLYVRGQPGYGGFLSIKFHTFNTTKYVIRDSKFTDLTDAQRLKLTSNFYNVSRIQKTLR